MKTGKTGNRTRRALWIRAFVLSVLMVGMGGCEGDGGSTGAFPVYRDDNGNAVNDYVEVGTHLVSAEDPRWHEYADGNGDGICDYAQRADPVWHGPGYVDSDGDGVCDYWDADSPRYRAGRHDMVHGSDFDEAPHMGAGPERGPQHMGM